MHYIILERARIGDLLNGKADTLYTEAPAQPGQVVAVKTARNRRPTCLLQITACEPDEDGFALTVRVHPHPHQPRLLAQDSTKGYTDKPYLAMRGEPEAVPDTITDQYAARAVMRHDKTVRERETRALHARRQLTVEERVTAARRAAKANYVDPDVIRKETRALRHMQRKSRPESVVIVHLEAFERVAYREHRHAG